MARKIAFLTNAFQLNNFDTRNPEWKNVFLKIFYMFVGQYHHHQR